MHQCRVHNGYQRGRTQTRVDGERVHHLGTSLLSDGKGFGALPYEVGQDVSYSILDATVGGVGIGLRVGLG